VTAVVLAAATATSASYVAGEETASGATPPSSAKSASRWKVSFQDDFSGHSINNRKWAVYNGGQRSASNAFVRNGHLVLRTSRVNGVWKAAGVTSSRALKQTYGRFVVRARLDRGSGTRAVALLWPTGGVWPPEIDFYELGATDPDRTRAYLTNHYTERNQMQHSVVGGDFTKWHRMSVTWRPNRLVYRLDGHRVATQRGHSPNHQMWLGLQSGLGSGRSAPNSRTPSTVDFEVDWVKAKRLPGRS
jgi:beta-glucanase (GH16 family)